LRIKEQKTRQILHEHDDDDDNDDDEDDDEVTDVIWKILQEVLGKTRKSLSR
jgi:hypothetical protein